MFRLAGDTAKQKEFRPFNANLRIGPIAIKRFRSSSRRATCRHAGMEFLIQSPSPDWIKRKTRFSVLCGSAVNLILKGQSKKCNEINRSRRGFLEKPSSKIEQRTGDFKATIG